MLPISPFQRLRLNAEILSANADHVRIDETQIPLAAELFVAQGLGRPGRGLDGHVLATMPPRQRNTFVLVRDAINFGSGYHDALHKPPGLSGSRTITARLARRFAEGAALSAEDLAST